MKRATTSAAKLRASQSTESEVAAPPNIQPMNQTQGHFSPSPKTNFTFMRESLKTDHRFKSNGMQFRKTKQSSKSPMRPSRLTDEELEARQDSEVAKIRRIKKSKLRDPIQMQKEIAERYLLPKDMNKDIMTPTINNKANMTFQSSADKKMNSMMEVYSS